MKFAILQQDLWPALQAVARSCGLRSSLPVLGNILLQVSGEKVNLAATNLEIGVVKSIKAEVEEGGEITIPSKTLTEIIANLANTKITFEGSNSQLNISTASFNSQINGIPASEFPSIPLSGKNGVSLESALLIKAIPQVTFAAASDEGRPILTGILTEIKDKKLQLVATDGYRLAHKLTEIAQPASFKALVPRRTFEEVARLILEEDTDQVNITTSEDQNQMVFTFGNTQLSSRLIEGQFPSWEKIIPTTTQVRVVLERVELLKAIKLASIFARSEANVIKLQSQQSQLVVASEAKELGSQQSEVEAQVDGENIQVAFNSKFLIEALLATDANQVVIEFSGPLSATLLRPLGEVGLQYIIMPVNLG